jgi:SEFIR domain
VSQALKVFISYGHDSPEHKERVLGLCVRLRQEGIDCDLDRYHEAPPEGWPAWMRAAIRDASFVLVVCSKTVHERFEGTAVRGTGLGAKWEGAIITADLYERESHNVKYIPVVLASEERRHIPDLLSAATFYDLSKPDGYELLYRRLTGQPEVLRENLGERVVLSARDVQWQDPELPSSGSSATIAFRTDLQPDEVSVYEALPAIERGEPVDVRWPSISDELYETLSARRPDLQRQLLDRGLEPGELVLRAIEAFDLALSAASQMRDRAAERIPLMWGGMAESGYWGPTLNGAAFRPALEHFLALANIGALLNMGSTQFEEDFRPLPGGLSPAVSSSQVFQLPAVTEVFDAEPPFWAIDVELAGVSLYIFAPRAMATQVMRSGAGAGGRFFRDFFVPQMEQRLIAQDRQLSYSPNDVVVQKLRDESFEETSW